MTDRPILFSAPMVRALLDGRKTQTRRIIKPQPEPCDHRFWCGQNASTWKIDGAEMHCSTCGNGMRLARRGEGAAGINLRFAKGDRLWVRETWRCNGWASDVATIFYRASESDGYTAMCEQWPVADHKPLRVEAKWAPSLHLPRWASRLTLTVTDVRAERLQAISEADAIAEGIFFTDYGRKCGHTAWGWTDVGDCLAPTETHPQRPGWMWGATTGHEHCLDTARNAYGNLWEKINGAGSWDANPWVVAVSFSVDKQNIDEGGRSAR